MKSQWTPQAKKGLDKVIDYLEREWTEKEIYNLEVKIEQLIKHIEKNPRIFPATQKHQNLRKALVDKNNYIIYRVRPEKDVIEIIHFRGTRQKPI